MSSAPKLFAKAAKAYRETEFAGSLIPLPELRKMPPPEGRTGRQGVTDRSTVKADAKAHPTANVGLRMPEWCIGIDVDGADHSEGKTGPEAIAAFEAKHGELPATLSTSRHGPKSDTRIHLFEIPEGVRLREKPFGGSVEIIQHHHRFAVVSPSRLADGSRYRWYDADRNRVEVPRREDIERLPDAWLDALRDDRPDIEEHRVSDADVQAWIDDLLPGDMTPRVAEMIAGIPTLEVGNSTLLAQLGPLVRAIHAQPGGAAAYDAFIEHIRPPYLAKYDSRKFQADLERALSRAIGDLHSQPIPVLTSIPFASLGVPSAPKRKLSGKKKGSKSKKAGKRSAGKADRDTAPVVHEEYEPSGFLAETKSPSRPREVAQDLLTYRALPPLVYREEQWFAYRDGHYSQVSNETVFDLVAAALDGASFWAGKEQEHWKPTPGKVQAVVRMLQGLCATDIPLRGGWLDGRDAISDLVPCRDGLLDPRSGTIYPRSSLFFSTRHLNADMRDEEREPKRWLRFLDSLWGDDAESIALLQEWLGYVISGDTYRQKGMLIVGPPRAGKGTILAIAEALVGGKQGATATSVTRIASNFGLMNLPGKSLLTVGDMRGTGKEAAHCASILLEMIGGDSVSVDRKGKTPLDEKMTARVMVATNIIPTLYDDAAAIETRFLILRTTRGFLGREDFTLAEKLEAELNAIAHWALEGYARLQRQNHFTRPASDEEDRRTFRQNANPALEFVENACTIVEGYGSTPGEVWRAYCRWFRDEHGVGTQPTLNSAMLRKSLIGANYEVKRPAAGSGDTEGARPRVHVGLLVLPKYSDAADAARVYGDSNVTPIDPRFANPN